MEVPCSICSRMWDRKFKSQNNEVEFVCRVCRCMDCQIVLNRECECGEVHGEASEDDSRLCTICVGIRARVAVMDKEFLKMREAEIKVEYPFYA